MLEERRRQTQLSATSHGHHNQMVEKLVIGPRVLAAFTQSCFSPSLSLITSFGHFSWCCPLLPCLLLFCSFIFICHPLIHLSVVFSFVPRCASSSVVSVSVEPVVSSSAHPGGARAPPGGRDCRRPAGPGPAQTPHHHDANHSWAFCQHLDNAAAAARAQWASWDSPVREESWFLD